MQFPLACVYGEIKLTYKQIQTTYSSERQSALMHDLKLELKPWVIKKSNKNIYETTYKKKLLKKQRAKEKLRHLKLTKSVKTKLQFH